MTEPAPERALAALKTIGMEERPVASLEREDALFVLTGSTLLFQDGAGTRRVTLRDLTRIHSDQEGLLRVETPAGTALTASLLGFDPAEVQSFFAQVRDATARVKQLPATPPTPLTKTFAAAPARPATERPAPVSPSLAGSGADSGAPESAPDPRPMPQVTTFSAVRPASRITDTSSEPSGMNSGVTSEAVASQASTSPTPASPVPADPVSPPAPASRPDPVIISSSGFSPAPRRTESRPVEPRPAVAPTAEPLVEDSSSVTLSNDTAPAAAQQPGGVTELAAQAGIVAALAGRLRLLGMVLFVGAIALAFFQFRADQRLEALWTLLAGGVGTVALTSLSELARLLAALGRRLSGPLDGTMDER
ncbi:hypothetical protein [Deinococcus navajonensis]|uniref:GRAM domain-containing protein n=1 Tax=Deinococcus navajonensis TaxID=309884 RepID=A0ABV8XLK7_9DEIO